MRKLDRRTTSPLILLITVLIVLTLSFQLSAQNSPLALNGRLKLVGNQLSNENGKAIQLRGMSTHGLQWFGGCYNDASINALANDWGADIIRTAMYVDEGGYLSDPQGIKNKVNQIASLAETNGMYCLIDWHILTPGNPWVNVNEAKAFFAEMASTYAGKKHILYEICNEPNNIDWPSIKGYALEIIPIIRQYDKDAIIIVGTPTWSGEPAYAANDPITGSSAYNVMYTSHVYAGTHYNEGYINDLLSRIPIFVTEWGTSNASGNGGNDYNNAQNWVNLWAGGNSAGIKVSWCNWTFSDANESSAALNPGSCGAGQWNNTSTSGTWVKNHILFPADDFGSGIGGGGNQSPYAGVIGIPGILEAENFDNGGEGVAYHDADAANLGGQYRMNYGVDIENCTEGGFSVGYLNPGEWLAYSVNIANTGTYKIDTRVASALAGGNFHIEVNGTNVTGTLSAPGTGGWQTWTTVSTTASLSAGAQTLKIVFETGGFNVNNLTFSTNATSNGLQSGTTYEIVAKHSGLSCDVANISIDNGANIQQWTYWGSANQKWTLYDVGNGFWKIINVNSGRCMEVGSFSNADGGNVQQWDYVGHNYQQWSISAADAGAYKIINRGSGKALDVANISLSNGANIQQWPYWGGANQQWIFNVVNATAKMSSTPMNDPSSLSSNSVLAYPNPVQNLIHVNLSEFEGADKKIIITDLKNKTMYEKSVTGSEYIVETSGLLIEGMYILTVKDEFKMKIEKLIVQP